MTRHLPPRTDDGTGPSLRGRTLVIGGGRTGLGIATQMACEGTAVTFAGEGATENERSTVEVLPRRIGDATAMRDVVDEVGDVAAVVVVGAGSETLLNAHLARRELADPVIVAVVDDPSIRAAFDGIGVDTVTTSKVLATALRDQFPGSFRA